MVDRIVFALAIAAAIAAGSVIGTAEAHAVPVCNGPDLPPCAPPPDPATLCAWIAFSNMTPCNWYGVQVPQGTPGSWG